MKRELNSLKDKTFDILVVGGGVYGAAVAWEAAGRGLKTALVERDDFGSHTTANSLKTIHGGLRYLQNLDIPRVRQCIRERTTLMRIAPHLVHPLSCLMPTYGHGMKGKEVMWAGLLLNDIVSCDRNALEDPEKRIPAGRIYSRTRTLALAPGIDEKRVTGGAFWTDAQMADSERLVLALVQKTADAGASVANYMDVRALIRRNDRIEGAECVDVLTGDLVRIRAQLVVNATGGWMEALLLTAGIEAPAVRLSTAMNLIINSRILPGPALGITSRFTYRPPRGKARQCSRVLFMAPWNGATLVGTRHKPYTGKPDDMRVTEAEIADFLEEINRAYPGRTIRRDEVSFFHKGFLPMDGVDPKNGDVILSKHTKLLDHQKEDGVDGLLSIAGVKYTTARDEARRTVNLAARKLSMKIRPSHSHRTPLAGGDIGAFQSFVDRTAKRVDLGLSSDTVRRLVIQYGSRVDDIFEIAEKQAPKARMLPGSETVMEAEIDYILREELAVRLTDVILRRTNLGTVSRPEEKILQAVASKMAGYLKWDSRRRQKEIDTVKSTYLPARLEGGIE